MKKINKLFSQLKGGDSNRGFTLVELLVVIAIIAILAIVVLSAINPLEVLRKSRDTERRSTATQLLNLIEGFNATYGCNPWEWDGTACFPARRLYNRPIGVARAVSSAASFNDAYDLQSLITEEVAKNSLLDKTSIRDGLKLWITEQTAANGNEVNICFEPESNAARTDNIYGIPEAASHARGAAGTCTASYNGTVRTGTCWICI